MRDKLQRFWLYRSGSPATGIVRSSPMLIPLEGQKVLDIYNVKMAIMLAVSATGIIQVGFGLSYIQRNQSDVAYPTVAQHLDKRDWICNHYVQYTAPAEYITEEHEWLFEYPYTTWVSPTMQQFTTNTGGTVLAVACFTELYGIIRNAKPGELQELQIAQRQDKTRP